MKRSLLRGRADGHRGQALVEFSLVIMVFLVILCGIFDLGSAVISYSSTTNAAREGARLAIVNQDVTSIQGRALNQAILSGHHSPIVDVRFWQPNDNGTPNTKVACTAPIAPGCIAVITYEATYTPITPLIAQILFPHGIRFTAQTDVIVEYSCPNAGVTLATDCPKQPR